MHQCILNDQQSTFLQGVFGPVMPAMTQTWPVLKPQFSVYAMPSNSPHNLNWQLTESSREELPLLQVDSILMLADNCPMVLTQVVTCFRKNWIAY